MKRLIAVVLILSGAVSAANDCAHKNRKPLPVVPANCSLIKGKWVLVPVKPLTPADAKSAADDLDRSVLKLTGMSRRALALTRSLQHWYEIDPNHPDALQESAELSRILRDIGVEHSLQKLTMLPFDGREEQIPPEVMVDIQRCKDIVAATNRELEVLIGMGWKK